SADTCAATAQPRMLATTSVSRAATTSGAAVRPTTDPRRPSGSNPGQRISAMASAACMTWLATVRSCVRSTSVRPPMPHADRSARGRAEVIHRPGRAWLNRLRHNCFCRQGATLDPEHPRDNGGHDDECQTEVAGDPLRELPVAGQRREDRLQPEVVAPPQEKTPPNGLSCP